jgi:hypothetical protein
MTGLPGDYQAMAATFGFAAADRFDRGGPRPEGDLMPTRIPVVERRALIPRN